MWVEEVRVRCKFYSQAPFKRIDKRLRAAYAWRSPFQISKAFLMEKGAQEIHVYGETPLTTLDRIAKRCALKPTDHFFDLGCGRGRGVLFLSHRYGCAATGIDWIPAFIATAQRLNAEKCRFVCQEFLDADLQKATVIYLYGSCLEDAYISALVKKFKTLKEGTKVITVSYPLADYGGEGEFALLETLTLPFLWGKTDVYLQEKRSQRHSAKLQQSNWA